jgi:hypothetical protein
MRSSRPHPSHEAPPAQATEAGADLLATATESAHRSDPGSASATALQEWLGPQRAAEFRRARAQRLPFAAPSIALVQPSLFDWQTLARVLRAEPPPDALVVRSNEVLDVPLPRDEAELRALFADGSGIVVRRAQTREDGLRALARCLAAAFAVEVHLQLFVTPARRHGFGWHYDADDVIILQTLGSKAYYFRANTQHPEFAPGATPDFTAVARETSPLMSCTLLAGDALYLPRGMWHAARAIEDSLSISVGLLA